MKNKMTNMFRKIVGFNALERKIMHCHQEQMQLIGALISKQNKNISKLTDLSQSEFKVFSQWGDDGIIQWLIEQLPIANEFFIEFGVQHYIESNTRFLLKNNNWSGLILDGNQDYIDFIKNDPIYWQHDIIALCHFLTKENIDNLLKENSPCEDIGLLSIDIDGNDYWIWESIHSLSPRIVVCEYNGTWGSELPLSTPYKEDFYRTQAHYSNLYFGASIQSLIHLSHEKGYVFVGTNSNGNNAYFVRKDIFHFIENKIEEVKIFSPKFRNHAI